ncbi:MAG: D-alanyl-D-alanine carboxypeptidase [Acetatifactor sp.]|nr:D-alanyl-D-alanine carboxypeptidase [Acetatifactor sp.]
MRTKKSIGGFFCALFLLSAIAVQTVWAAQPINPQPDGSQQEDYEDPASDISLYATAAALLDADSGRVLYGKNADTPMAMASTTKIMTCIQVLENASLDETLTVSAYAASMPQVKLYIKKGEEYAVRDLLYSLMLESHNDSAVALAEHVGRSLLSEELRNKPVSEYTAEESRQAVAAFAGLMNAKAEELGCVNTWFITPNGLDATEETAMPDGSLVTKEHCTTAAELARIMAYCIGESDHSGDFLAITQTPSYSFYANGRSFSCTNHNAFLNMMDGALSGKTGFTNKAGYCYVGALESEGRVFVVALLACGWPNNKSYKWSDTRELMEYGIENFSYKSFTEKGVAFDESGLNPIPVSEGQTEILGETAYTSVEIVGRDESTDEHTPSEDSAEPLDRSQLLMRTDEKIQVDYKVEEQLTAPVESGTRVGVIEYSVGGTVYRREDIVTTDTVERIDLRWCVHKVLQRFLL